MMVGLTPPHGLVVVSSHESMLKSCCHKLEAAWRRCQVELTGEYSVERLLALDAYNYVTSRSRILIVFFATIVPCLVAIMILESFPLAPIQEGIHHSHNFWYRTTIGTYMVTLSIIAQYHHGIPELGLTPKQLVLIPALTTAVVMPILYGMNVWIGYPMPFFVALSMIPWSPTALVISWFFVHDRLREKPHLLLSFKKHTIIFNAQSFLIIVYPAYTYIFNSYPKYQTWLALLLPMIKLLLKNLFGYVCQHLQDAQPEHVVFNVDIFSALYVSSCMQSASSMETTIVIMVVDFIQGWMSIKDLNDVLDDPVLQQALNSEKDATRQLVPLTMHILQYNRTVSKHPSINQKSFFPTEAVLTAATQQQYHGRGAFTVGWPVVPVETTHHKRAKNIALQASSTTGRGNRRSRFSRSFVYTFDSLHTLFIQRRVEATPEFEKLSRLMARLNEQEQLLVVQKTLRILHISEFVALVEYAEVFVPIVYSLFCVIAYTFPNGRYYTTFGALSPHDFTTSLGNVILYGSLELLSFVALDVVMRHKFHMSTFTLTAFVLETQWAMVQSKLTLWMLIVLQFALVHYGCDFSFQFEWLKN